MHASSADSTPVRGRQTDQAFGPPAGGIDQGFHWPRRVHPRTRGWPGREKRRHHWRLWTPWAGMGWGISGPGQRLAASATAPGDPPPSRLCSGGATGNSDPDRQVSGTTVGPLGSKGQRFRTSLESRSLCTCRLVVSGGLLPATLGELWVTSRYTPASSASASGTGGPLAVPASRRRLRGIRRTPRYPP